VTHIPTAMEKRLRAAGILVFLGLLIEVFALRWTHPTAFLAFAMIGVPVVLAGVLWFLYSLVTVKASSGEGQ
jgi:hypothetical protein